MGQAVSNKNSNLILYTLLCIDINKI